MMQYAPAINDPGMRPLSIGLDQRQIAVLRLVNRIKQLAIAVR